MIFWIVLALIAIILLKLWIIGPMYTKNHNLEGKVIIITGSNIGLGRATAKELAKYNPTIILACRNLEQAKEA